MPSGFECVFIFQYVLCKVWWKKKKEKTCFVAYGEVMYSVDP